MKYIKIIFLLIISTQLIGQSDKAIKQWQPIFEKDDIPENLQTAFYEAPSDTAQIVALDKIGDYLFFDKSPKDAMKYYEGSLALAQQMKIRVREGLSLYYISDVYLKLSDYDKAHQYIDQSIALFKEIKDYKGLARAYRHKGLLELETEATLVWYNKALEEALKTDDRILQRLIMNNIGGKYLNLQKYDLAADILFKSLHSAEEDKDTLSVAWSYRNIGKVFSNKKDYQKAVEYYEKAVPLFMLKGDNRDIAILNKERGILFFDLKQYDKALETLQSTIPFWYQYNQPFWTHETVLSIAMVLAYKGDYQASIDSIEKLIAIRERGEIPKVPLAYHHFLLGKSYIGLGDYTNALPYLQSSLDSATIKFGNPYENVAFYSDYYTELSELYAKSNEPTQANAMLHKLVALKDTAIAQANIQRYEELEATYKTNQQQELLATQDSQIKQQRLLNSLLAVFAVLLLSFGLFAYRTAQQRKFTNALLKKQKADLQSLDRAKSQFFANISHELRTPLTLIISPIESAINKVKSKTAKADLAMAHKNSKRLLSLVNEILDLSKLESGKMQLHETAVPLEKLLRRIFFSYHSLSQLRGVMLSFAYHLPSDLVATMDVEKFEKVLNNLLSNAVKHTPQGGVVTLRAIEENGLLKIAIEDTGKGIAPENQEKIFDRFYQVEAEGGGVQGGSGIGLAYAKEIARLFGGNLTVTSELTKGSVFTFFMPLNKAVSDVSVNTTPTSGEEINTQDTVIFPIASNGTSIYQAQLLIVEDNPEMNQFLVQTLSPYFSCLTAFDGEEAYEMVQQNKVDLIISDVMMPNMDGFDFMEKVKKHDRYIPSIMLTARAMEEDKLKGLAIGVDDYLTKPFNTKELVARVFNLLKNKKSREQYIEETADSDAVEDKALTADEQFLQNIKALVYQQIDNPNYKITDLAHDATISQRQLERNLKKLTGFAPVEFVREIRLQKAYQLLESRQFATIADVRYAVGMENASYFTKKFKERFGKKPSEV